MPNEKNCQKVKKFLTSLQHFATFVRLYNIWGISDTSNGFMAIPNLIALLGLSGVVIKLTKDYFSNEK